MVTHWTTGDANGEKARPRKEGTGQTYKGHARQRCLLYHSIRHASIKSAFHEYVCLGTPAG